MKLVRYKKEICGWVICGALPGFVSVQPSEDSQHVLGRGGGGGSSGDCMGAVNGSWQVSALYSITLICGQKRVKSRPRSDTPIKSNVLLFLLEKRAARPSVLTSPLLLAVVLDELICQQRQLRTGRGCTACQGAAPAVLFQPPHPTSHPTLNTHFLLYSPTRRDSLPGAVCVCGWARGLWMCQKKWVFVTSGRKRNASFRMKGGGGGGI